MRSWLRRLDTRQKKLALAVACFVSVLYTLLLILMGYVAAAYPTPMAAWFLIPFVFLCVMFWGNLIWLIVSMQHLPRWGAGCCAGFGYSLFRLTVCRCPECGRPFTFREVRRTPDQLEFAGPRDEGTAQDL